MANNRKRTNGKLLERIIYSRLYCYLEQNSLLIQEQSENKINKYLAELEKWLFKWKMKISSQKEIKFLDKKWGLNYYTLGNLYKSLIGSVIDYFFPCLNSFSETNIKKIQVLQNSEVNFKLKLKYDTPFNILHHQAFNKLKLLAVSNRLFKLSVRYGAGGLRLMFHWLSSWLMNKKRIVKINIFDCRERKIRFSLKSKRPTSTFGGLMAVPHGTQYYFSFLKEKFTVPDTNDKGVLNERIDIIINKETKAKNLFLKWDSLRLNDRLFQKQSNTVGAVYLRKSLKEFGLNSKKSLILGGQGKKKKNLSQKSEILHLKIMSSTTYH
ncbi:hypothetical protein BpHYR1_031953 [Brachionus plicatilis]|uniref:RNA-directed DNA polymerase from mobile element jockey-like n=1 Tax=Brachionus plicatilis TaxID=10195 RepID=A0A3M7S430_BRAPC|nr:hypothetical protein BpHYR1_031953 [Brachionus plicatilis]